MTVAWQLITCRGEASAGQGRRAWLRALGWSGIWAAGLHLGLGRPARPVTCPQPTFSSRSVSQNTVPHQPTGGAGHYGGLTELASQAVTIPAHSQASGRNSGPE